MTRLLLDTHFLIWLINSPDELSQREHVLISAPGTQLIVSAVSIWELRTKWNLRHARGSRKGDVPPQAGIEYAVANGIDLVPMTADDASTELEMPPPHRDPFDEMLLVHAQQLGAKLLTRDRRLLGHPLALQL